MELNYNLDKPAVVKDWNKSVREGMFIPVGHVILTFEEIEASGAGGAVGKLQRFKANKAGIVEKLLVPKGEVIKRGTPLLLLGPCKHPTVMKDMCAECGMDLRKLDEPKQQASVSMVHSVPELRVSMEQAQKLGKVDEDRLLDKRKLVLLVDLDQTLIHTTNDNVPNNLKDVFHFQLWGHGTVWYHTRIRPYTQQFLENISKLYELHICTFGTRQYAYTIAHHLDPSRKLFSDRILSRDECFSQNSKTANLKELFPRGDHMVCIIDDREDVWNFAPNLIHVKPYHFFRHTGDINAPPGLTKKDQDDKTGFQFVGDKVDSSKPPSGSDGTDGNNKNKGSIKPEEASNSDTSDAETSLEKLNVREVATDLNLSEEDESDNNDSDREDVAIDADMEESNDDELLKTKNVVKSTPEAEESSKSAEVKEKKEEAGNCNDVSAVGNANSETSPPENTDATVSNNPTTVEEKTEEDAVKPDEKMEKVADKKPDGKTEEEVADKKPDEKTEEEEVADKKPEDKTSESEVDGGSGSSTSKVMEVEDSDDYLLYLEHILKSIHNAFYSLYDDMSKRKETGVPDVKIAIPYVRKKVMKNISIVFSGVVPTHVPLKSSKAYQIAINLGAQVSDKIIPQNKPGSSASMETPTTHVVAARMGTAKVNEARRYKGMHIVTPEWLWTCAERWEHVEEKLFRLDKAKSVRRNPPAHCSSPDFRREKFEPLGPIDGPDEQKPSTSKGKPGVRKERTPSGRFMDTINPLLSFSADEIDTMAHEVDDIINESASSSSDDEEEIQKEKERAARRRSSRSLSGQERDALEDPSTSELTKESMSSSSSSSDSSNEGNDSAFGLTSECHRKRKRCLKTETETEDEPISAKFRRGEPLPSDIDSLNLMNASSDDDDAEGNGNEEDEWMAQALEREFLDENSQSQDPEGFNMR
ncbi:RNA polymerase II subunit A C-terminal domain phosphatase [Orchesella cincta]|uniref:RNA polymerase II subunit A C-terminal domain phosphatase n=1 Tax=Orchesella cincta TaxID=48709 RepID=A0A1D2MCW3_ORCCI|nr:RNA polymerase II subunit A C-terminal domain phosphatase [Orchesella cincta]